MVSIGVSLVCVVQNIDLTLATTSLGRNSNVIDKVLESSNWHIVPLHALSVLPPALEMRAALSES